MPKKANGKVKGKWGHLVGVLPKITQEEPGQLEKIDALRAEIIAEYQKEHPEVKHPPTAFLVDQYLALRDAKDALKTQLSNIELEISALQRMISDKYEEEGLQSLRTTDGVLVAMHYEPHAVVTDKEANRKWAIANGFEQSLALPWGTVNAEVKAALESGNAVYDGEKLVGGPDGVDVYLITKFQKRG